MTVPPRTLTYFPAPRAQHFCSQCGSTLTRRVPADDNRERDICDQCGAIHYQNPRMVVGTIPVWEKQVLLCRRAIEPRYGYWTLPAGFMELGETTAQGAARETNEEAGAQIEMGQMFAMLDIPHVDQVHIFYLARLTSLDFDPGPESLEAQLFGEDDIPWDELAFRSVSTALRFFFADRARGEFQIHCEAIQRIEAMAPARAP